MSAQSDAIQLVNQFAANTEFRSAFVFLSGQRQAVANSLIQRINNPDLIAQRETSLCGPSALIRTLAYDDPVTYARAATELYDTGETWIGTMHLAPSATLRAYALPAGAAVDPADWILAAGVRDSDNWFFSYATVDSGFSAMTLPHSLASWFQMAGYTDVTSA